MAKGTPFERFPLTFHYANTNEINNVALSEPGKKSIPPTLSFPLEGGGLGRG